MSEKPANYRAPWERRDLVLALDLYCRIPFHKVKSSHPRVLELAKIIQRSPAAVSMKIGNFGAFDPALRQRSIGGLKNTSSLDKVVWDEFCCNWNLLSEQASELRNQLDPIANHSSTDQIELPTTPSERMVLVKQRLHQQFFRDAVLSSYDNRCCITGLALSECLVAGHIIPWKVDELRRADPSNGLCLAATFDRLFDRNLMTLADDLTIIMSRAVLEHPDEQTRSYFREFQGRKIQPPGRFMPNLECLRWHRARLIESTV